MRAIASELHQESFRGQDPTITSPPAPKPVVVPYLALSAVVGPAPSPGHEPSPVPTAFGCQGPVHRGLRLGNPESAPRLPLTTRRKPCRSMLQRSHRGRETFVHQLRSSAPLGAQATRIGGGGLLAPSRPATLIGERSPLPGPPVGPGCLGAALTPNHSHGMHTQHSARKSPSERRRRLHMVLSNSLEPWTQACSPEAIPAIFPAGPHGPAQNPPARTNTHAPESHTNLPWTPTQQSQTLTGRQSNALQADLRGA